MSYGMSCAISRNKITCDDIRKKEFSLKLFFLVRHSKNVDDDIYSMNVGKGLVHV